VGVDYGAFFEVRTARGVVVSGQEKQPYDIFTLLAQSYLWGGAEVHWDGTHTSVSVNTGPTRDGVAWAVHVGDTIAVYVSLAHPREEPQQGSWAHVPPQVWAGADGFFLPERRVTSLHWEEILDGAGCGAIAEDLRVAVAMQDRRFLVFDGTSDPQVTRTTRGVRLVDTTLAFVPYDISVVSSGYALLSVGHALDGPPFASELDRALAIYARRIEFPLNPPARWKTIVHHLGPDGRETWRHEIPFEVLQPPIDAGRGRIYLMGNGTAAIQDGKLLFATQYTTPMFGTAFEDGAMAISAGAELRIIGPDGRLQQTFTTAEHEPITTPPAIGSDGSVWVGTGKAVYVAR
jgi:hypothetical protein